MRYYAFVAPGYCGVYTDYNEVKPLKALLPYSKVRKFNSEVEAWQFVDRNRVKHHVSRVRRYGNTFDKHYVTVDYFIEKEAVYYNINSENLGYINLTSSDPNVLIQNRTHSIKVKLSNIVLNDNLLSSHAIAIYHILNMLGSFVDVELVVPDHSVYYMLSAYTGSKKSIVRLKKFIEDREGKVALTVKNW